MKEIIIKIDDYGCLYAEMPNGMIRQLVAQVYDNTYFAPIRLGKEVEAEEDKDGET